MNNNISTEKRTGIFISGFRWSGSSAVSDWLESFSVIRKPPDSKSANDEIRALNYGLTLFLKAAQKPLFYGEKLARYSMWPDSSMWKEIFGKPLSLERGLLYPVISILDTLFMAAAAGRLNPGIDSYSQLLCSSLAVSDYRIDGQYIAILGELTEAVKNTIKTSPSSWNEVRENKSLANAVSRFLSLFYDRLSADSNIPVFDNAFSGLTPRFFDLVKEDYFKHQIIVFVIRDPRDQFAEQVKYSTKTFPFMAGRFVSDYKKLVKTAMDYAASCSSMPGKSVRVIGFEDFVLDRNNTRSDLRQLVENMLEEAGVSYTFNSSQYNPKISAENIGVWKGSAMEKKAPLIEQKLPEYLFKES